MVQQHAVLLTSGNDPFGDAIGSRVRRTGLPIGDELDGAQQAETADVAHRGVVAEGVFQG
ncbi:hypothetical protein [Streptomyces sp. SID13031]|uniref:hypothetical protein n=1 Tax=Streptomyces sp. SID13031 TaxID=2706046 RepID=UPI001EF317C7|nr:hypothetical protein [Streptomyces sp. SID13031]